MADWVVDSGDNKNMPFVILDKKDAKVYVFHAHGGLRGAAPVLLGITVGDDSFPGVGNKPLSLVKPETLKWNGEFGCPTVIDSLRAHVPDGVPVPAQTSVFNDQSVDKRAQRVGREVKGIAGVTKSIQQDLDFVVNRQVRIARHLRSNDPAGGRVITVDADVKVVGVIEETDVRSFGSWNSFTRFPLHDLADERSPFPIGILQRPVDRNSGIRPNDHGSVLIR